MDSTVQYDKHYAANRFRRTGTTGSRRYGAAREWRKEPTARELADSAGHAGHLFQERFKGIVVQKETHFLAFCRYVVNDLRNKQAWIAFRFNGQDLAPEHGGPARLLVPHLYLWKSAKWVRGLTLMHEDKPGFWESLGYHNYGDPWREQRHWGD
jgi:hypothetical protein